ncbi:related to Pantothenate transporter FEN2 [Saccharomycodes ludwigii]|uniref:Related to Pantothenate transporter FEN2 n=1 Tax=Saccharomycodes ludwigii TaxID=36035 RepID=A0A376B6N7_9ASCO|nr:hypothetical protein SCDLUD_003945 [Saccharomycodes ludwigii]KAH3899662.1 hypothetical protein SCDLUD_003945 [Saccharomycodes ludwigii]SSD60134.1 related to Pantothenate transporter FEN2 [Saccharomycodes ludwigii]
MIENPFVKEKPSSGLTTTIEEIELQKHTPIPISFGINNNNTDIAADPQHSKEVDTFGETNRNDSTPINEKKLLFKIDACVLTFVCLQYWINYVDRVGFTNAYVSGMKEDLQLKGNDFNIINTCFTVGYIISMIPHNLMLLKIPPRIWSSFCTLSWGLLTLGMYRVSSFRQCCAIRFFQGVFESCTFSGTHLVLGSWYKESELPFRSSIFTSSGLIGSIFSGFMQVGIYKSLNNHQGLEGWRWLFIIDFVITIPIAIYGFLCFPNPPNTYNDLTIADDGTTISRNSLLNKFSLTKYVFTEQELLYSGKRLPKRDVTKRLDLTVIKRVIGRWHWWLFSLVWALGGLNISFASNSTFALWLADLDYSITQRNDYPMGIFSVGIIATLLSALYMTLFRNKHLHIAIFISIVMVVVAIMILCNPLKPSVMFAAQYLGGVCYAGQSVYFAWANVICSNDLQERAVVLASMNMFSGAINAWWSILFYPATTAPKFRRGGFAMLGTSIATAIVAGIITICQKREERLKQKNPIVNYSGFAEDGQNDEILGEEDEEEEEEEEEEQ